MTAHPKTDMHALIWRSESEFQDHHRSWNALADQMPDSSVFLRHEWFDAAWQWAREDSELYIIAIRDGDRIIGIAPLIRRRIAARLPYDKLLFLTVPDTQVCDILAEPQRRPKILAAILHTLQQFRKEWDVLELAYLTPTAAAEFVLAAEKSGHAVARVSQGNNPGLSLTDTWEQYYARRSRRLKKGNNLIANKLRKGNHQFLLDHQSGGDLRTTDSVTRLMNQIIAVSAVSWKRKLGLSLDFPGPNAFIRRLFQLAVDNDWLSVWRLEIDGETMAMEFQLRYKGSIHALRSDFDERAGDLSPGTFLNWKMLEQLFDGANRRYLMGPGENAYKLRWAEEFDPIERLTVFNNTKRGRLQALLDLRIRPWLRRTRDRWQASRTAEKEKS